MDVGYNALVSNVTHAWLNYSNVFAPYMEQYRSLPNTLENQHILYTGWLNLGDLWKQYTETLKLLGEFTNWSESIPVTYGEAVGFCNKDHTIVFLNAFPGYDEETALCRGAYGGEFLMRVGGLPDGVVIMASSGCYRITHGKPVKFTIM